MRTLLLLSMMAFLTLGCSKEDGVAPSADLPLTIGINFQIVNSSTGEDLFTNSDAYNVEAIKVYVKQVTDTPWQDSIQYEHQGENITLRLPQMVVHEKDSISYLLALTPSDYDTVSLYTEAAIEYDTAYHRSFAELKKLRLYYNGQFIEERDFTENEELLEKTIQEEIVNTFYKEVKKED